MPIGKNAIKRVVNNGYANLKSDAPDMENSVTLEPKPEKKSRAKNPIPKGITTSGASGTKNPVPKGALALDGIVKNTVTKKSKPKTVKIIPLEEEPEVKIEPKTEEAVKAEEVKAEPEVVKAEPGAEAVIEKSMEREPDFSPVKTAEKLTDTDNRTGYINIGAQIPVYLL